MPAKRFRNRKKEKRASLHKAQFTHPPQNNLFCIWAFSEADKGGPWAWMKITEKDLKEVIKKLGDFETMRSSELTGSHSMGTAEFCSKEQICSKAQTRLKSIKSSEWLEESDGIISFRISGKKRLWCLLDTGSADNQTLYQILWWDPEHEVWPTEKKHT